MVIKLRYLHKRIHHWISRSSSSSLSLGETGMGLRSRSEENLKKLSDCMENMDDDVSKLFMEYHQTNFREDLELLCLLNDYFATSKGVSELCESLRKSLQRAEHDECYLIDVALRDFKEEKLGYDASFSKTFIDLSNFSQFCGWDFLSSEFLRKTQRFHDDLANMIVKLEKIMKKIDKKLKRVRGLRSIIAATLLASVIVLITVSQNVTGFFGSESVAKFVALKWKKSTETLKREKTAMISMERGTMVALKEIEKISKLVSRLESVERSIRVTVELAIKTESSVEVAMRGMEKESKRLKSMIFELDKETERCDDFAQFGRCVAKEKIVEFISRGGRKQSRT